MLALLCACQVALTDTYGDTIMSKQEIEALKREFFLKRVATQCPTRFAVPSQASRKYLREEVRSSHEL